VIVKNEERPSLGDGLSVCCVVCSGWAGRLI
jgi:hypothetical protein